MLTLGQPEPRGAFPCTSARIHAAILALCARADHGVGHGQPPKPEPKEAGGPGDGQARAAIAKDDWTRAGVLREAWRAIRADADAHNLYAYSLRRGPNPQMDVVFRHYNEALRIGPEAPRRARVLGEAYLMSGQPAQGEGTPRVSSTSCAPSAARSSPSLQKEVALEQQHAASSAARTRARIRPRGGTGTSRNAPVARACRRRPRCGSSARELRAAGRGHHRAGAGRSPTSTRPTTSSRPRTRAMRAGQTHYTQVDGTPELKAAIIAKFRRENGLEFKPENISAGAGGKADPAQRRSWRRSIRATRW